MCVVMLCLLPLKIGGLLSDRLGLSAICAGNYARVASVTWLWWLWLHGAGQLGLRAASVWCRVGRGGVVDWYRRPSHCDWHCIGVGSAFVVSTVLGVRLGLV